MGEYKPDANHAWHVWINRRQDERRKSGEPFEHDLYEWKNALGEMRRLPRLFKALREGTLPKVHRQCSHSAPESITENRLRCCLGEDVSECIILASLRATLTEQRIDAADQDRIQGDTCAWHIYQNSSRCDTSEGYITDESDRRFWSNLYESLAAGDDAMLAARKGAQDE